MDVVVRMQDSVSAQQLVDFLRAQGVACTVAGGLLDSAGPFSGVFKAQYSIVVLDRSSLTRARELTAEYLATLPDLDESWEADSEPDLSLLHPSLLPRCPACSYALLALPADSSCPACHKPMDLLALVLAEHGPEALIECYEPRERSPDDEEALRAMDLPCPGCRYSLRGLDPRGRCPECGRPYDKSMV